MSSAANLAEALWQIYRRSERPEPWEKEGNLPWNDPDFSRRMLREHLDERHGAASRVTAERERQLAWLWRKLGLQAGSRMLDLTCGPGLYAVALAREGIEVTGVDFGPASIAHARALAAAEGVADRCQFVEADVRSYEPEAGAFDASLFLYGQLAVFPREIARQLLQKAATALWPGGALLVELLDRQRVDKKHSTWWFADDTGLWGDAPFINLGERFWYEDEKLSCERYYTLHVESGKLDEVILCDQTYSVDEMVQMMGAAGFARVDVYPAWDGMELYDAQEWNVYVAHKAA
jgi:SAM-dependent methyltransferase